MAGKRLKHVTDDGGEILRRLSPVIFRFVPADVTEVGVRLTVTPENGDLYVVEGEGRVNRSAGTMRPKTTLVAHLRASWARFCRSAHPLGFTTNC